MDRGDFSNLTGFEWDDGNLNENCKKHQFTTGECEKVFFNEPLYVHYDENHSLLKNRYFLPGETNEKIKLFFVFTPLKSLIRILSACDMHKNKKKVYKHLKKDIPHQSLIKMYVAEKIKDDCMH